VSSRPAQPSLDDVARGKLAALERRQLRRRLVLTERRDATNATQQGASLVSFSCNDYLGLSHHPEVSAASVEATKRYGAGAGSSRLLNGNHPLYAELESKLAALKGSEDAVVFGSGYLTNVGVIPALVGRPDLILLDELSHSCLLAGAELAGSRVLVFRHNDVTHLAELLAAERTAHRHCLVLTDGVFSMDGDLAPLPALAALAAEHDAWLMSDDAHGLGVVGDGRGSTFAHGEHVAVPLQMGTLSKAVGSYGGYLCTSRSVAELVRNRARTFVYSTGLPPGVVAAASRALDLIATDRALVRRPVAHARAFTSALGLAPAASPIVPLVQGAPKRALDASAALRNAGFLVPAIRPPTVPAGTARLRVAFSAAHTEEQVAALAAAVIALEHT
jgi:8-amino-7-oxononanoate synthase